MHLAVVGSTSGRAWKFCIIRRKAITLCVASRRIGIIRELVALIYVIIVIATYIVSVCDTYRNAYVLENSLSLFSSVSLLLSLSLPLFLFLGRRLYIAAAN